MTVAIVLLESKAKLFKMISELVELHPHVLLVVKQFLINGVQPCLANFMGLADFCNPSFHSIFHCPERLLVTANMDCASLTVAFADRLDLLQLRIVLGLKGFAELSGLGYCLKHKGLDFAVLVPHRLKGFLQRFLHRLILFLFDG